MRNEELGRGFAPTQGENMSERPEPIGEALVRGIGAGLCSDTRRKYENKII